MTEEPDVQASSADFMRDAQSLQHKGEETFSVLFSLRLLWFGQSGPLTAHVEDLASCTNLFKGGFVESDWVMEVLLSPVG